LPVIYSIVLQFSEKRRAKRDESYEYAT